MTPTRPHRSRTALDRAQRPPNTPQNGEFPMPGRSNLPAGEIRKASQRRSRRPAPPRTAVAVAARRRQAGDQVLWREHVGFFLREVDNSHADVIIGARAYRVARSELHPVNL